MNQFQRTLKKLPKLKESLGEEFMDKAFVRFMLLTQEIDIQMDGVNCPAAAADVLNALRSLNNELDVSHLSETT